MSRKKLAGIVIWIYALTAVCLGVLYFCGKLPDGNDEAVNKAQYSANPDGEKFADNTAGGAVSVSDSGKNDTEKKDTESTETVSEPVENPAESNAEDTSENFDNQEIKSDEAAGTDSAAVNDTGDLADGIEDFSPVTNTDGAKEDLDDSAEVTENTGEEGMNSAESDSSDNEENTDDTAVEQPDADADKTDDALKETEEIHFVTNITTTMNVRKEASASSEKIGELKAGDHGIVLEQGSQFSYIVCGDITGYVSNDFIIIGEAADSLINGEKLTMVKITQECYARSGPGTDYDIVATVLAGSKYRRADDAEATGKWIPILLNDGKTAYVSTGYSKLEN